MGRRWDIIGLSLAILGIATVPLQLYLESIGMITPSFAWIYLIITAVFIVFGVGLLLYGIRKKDEQIASKEQNKSPQAQNSLSVGEFLGYVHAHKCSKCGWGIKVDIFNKIATCPKCGNVDNVYDNSPKLPHIELHITYRKHTIGYAGLGKYKEIRLKEGTLIVDVEADFRPTGQMKIETVELSIAGKRLPSLNGEVQNSSERLWFIQDNIFDLSGISIGSHDVELMAFGNKEWWRSHPFSIEIKT